MSFFIASAQAADAAAAAAPNPILQILPFVGIFVLMYFFMIRPQRKRQKEHQELLSALGKGDEVVLNSGMLGKIVEVDDAYLTLDVADNVKMKFQKHAVVAVLPKGTIKAI
ncbi:MAG TPA: preprotein translocase subunit YajC [Cellvibrionaceae bacterium]|nr:preprotein translocase subunit YajC [Cellvibrionaceae bacterium]